MEISTTSGSGRTACTLLDKPVGFRCLASLLGVGGARLEKKAGGAPDLRFGRKKTVASQGLGQLTGFYKSATMR